MGLLDNFIAGITGRSNKPQGGTPARQFLTTMQAFRAPPRRGTAELMDAYRRLPFLRKAISVLANAVGSTQWELYIGRKRKTGKTFRWKELQRTSLVNRVKMIGEAAEKGDLERVEDHPFLDFTHRANSYLTGLAAFRTTQTHVDLKGEWFWLLTRNPLGMPVEWWPIPSHWIVEIPNVDNNFHFRVSFNGYQGDIPASEMIYGRDPDPGNPYGRGVGVGEALSDELDTDEYASKYLKSWFYNRASPDLIIEMPDANPATLMASEINWLNKLRGVSKAHLPFFSNLPLKITEIGRTFAEMQLVEMRKTFGRDYVHQVLGIPPEIIGINESSNRATIDAASYLLALYGTVPRVELLRSEMQEKLIPQFDENLILHYKSPVPEDLEFKKALMAERPECFTANEIRRLAGEETKPDGDVYFMDSGKLMRRKLDEETDPIGEDVPFGEDEDKPEIPEAIPEEETAEDEAKLLHALLAKMEKTDR